MRGGKVRKVRGNKGIESTTSKGKREGKEEGVNEVRENERKDSEGSYKR